MKYNHSMNNKEKTNQEKNRSVIRAIYGLTVLISVILVVNAVMGIIALYDMHEHNIEVIDTTLDEYYRLERTRFNAASHFVEWTAVNDSLIQDVKTHKHEGDVMQDLTKLRSRIYEMKYTFGDDFMFFMSTENGNRFYAISEISTSYAQYKGLKNELIGDYNKGSKALAWKVYMPKDGSAPFLYYGFIYNDVYIATAVNIERITGTMDNIALGKLGYYRFIDSEGTILLEENGSDGSTLNGFYAHFVREGDTLPYSIEVYADVYTSIVEQQIRQFAIFFVFLILFFITINYLKQIYQGILLPIEQFEIAIKNAEDEDSLITLESTSVKELKAASNQLKSLVNQIRDMRISIYEDELSKRHFQITFLQNQIKPHFYLNCLSTIDSMIQLGEYEQARELILFTSKYIRYMFQAGREYVRLEYELSHIQAYLDIQNMRMDHSFEYEENASKETLSVLIPPLLLITFVENCVKHAVAPDGEKLKINISTIRQDDNLVIDIWDSGNGFDKSWLEEYHKKALDNAEITTIEEHIGIQNSIHRLNLIYGENYKIDFFNDTAINKGAHIHIELPWMDDVNKLS